MVHIQQKVLQLIYNTILLNFVTSGHHLPAIYYH